MMDYKLQEEELLASFRPSEPNPNHSPGPPRPPNNLPLNHHPQPAQQYPLMQPQPLRHSQPLSHKEEQIVFQSQPRPQGPPVTFNYQQTSPNPLLANSLQRESIVKQVMLPATQVPPQQPPNLQQRPPSQSQQMNSLPQQPPQILGISSQLPGQNSSPSGSLVQMGNQRQNSSGPQPVSAPQGQQPVSAPQGQQMVSQVQSQQLQQSVQQQQRTPHYPENYHQHAVYPGYLPPNPYPSYLYYPPHYMAAYAYPPQHPNPQQMMHPQHPYYPPIHPPHQALPPPLPYEEINSLPPKQRQRLWREHQQMQQQLAQQQPLGRNFSGEAKMQQQYREQMQQQYHQQMQQQYHQQMQEQQYAQGNGNYQPQGQPPQYAAQEYPPEEYPQQEMNPQQYSEQYGYPPPEGYQYPPQYYQQQGFTEYPPQYYEAAQGQSTLWQERFFYLYQKYESFYQKYEGLNKQGAFLADQFLSVDSQQEWLALKEKYDSLVERMNEVKEENALILQEMQENIQQNQKIENGAIKEEAGRVWEHRYHELLQQYESLSHHYAQLQSSSMAHNDIDENERLSMMNQKYSRLEAEYNHVVQELQNSQNAMQLREEHEDLLKYTSQLQGYIEQLQSENNNLMRGMKTSIDGSKMLQESEITHKLVEKDNEIKNLSHIIVTLEEKVKSADLGRPKSNLSKDVRTSQLENQVQEMTLYCNELQQKLSMKDYEINGLNDKLAYLEEQLQLKQQEVTTHSKLLQDRLTRIEEDLSRKSQPVPSQPGHSQPLPSFSLEQDYDSRIKEYQRSIQGKNREIQALEERVADSEALTRKISVERSNALRELQEKAQQAEEENRKKVQERELRIRVLEQEAKEKEYEGQRKLQDKQNSLRGMQGEMGRLKQEIQLRLVQKDAIIKGLREATQRISSQLRDKHSQISRIKSPTITPHLHSPNQSFVADSYRHDEELRVLAEQLERRNDEIAKLKKERDSRNKLYKDLEAEYEALQEENNKRRIQVNNLKRQSVTIDNLQLEADNLRSNIAKKNQEITELKNSLFEKDRLRMELQSAKRELEKQSELSRLKNREIEQLTDRNYELEEKIRQKEFKAPVKQEFASQRNQVEQLQQLREELRKRQMELTRLKAENDDLDHKLRRETEELEALKLRYPGKLKSAEEELSESKLKLSLLEKKYSALEARAKEAEQHARKAKAAALEEQNSQLGKTHESFNKIIARLQDQNQSLKQKTRTYELKLNELETEVDSFASRAKELQVFKDDHAKRLANLSEKLETKEEELKNVRQKSTNQVLKFRKKENRAIELEAALKSRDQQARESQKQKETLRNQLRSLKKEYEDYRQQVLQQMEYSTHREMQNLNKQLNQYQSKFALQNYNFEFKSKDKKANQVFERTVIYQLKEENDFLRRQLEGRGSSISLQKMRINQMQQQALLKSKGLNRPQGPSVTEELEFYRQKNKELQERVNSHIAVNKNLKERIEQLASNSKLEGENSKELLIEELQRKTIELQALVRRLQQQNRQMRQDLSKREDTRSTHDLFQLQLNQLNRTVTQISLHRDSLIEEIKVVVSERNKFESELHQLQKSLSRAENKLAMQHSEIERLKDVTRAQKASSFQADLKLKLENLMSQLAQKETLLSEYHIKASHFQSECLSLQRALKDLENRFSQTKIPQPNTSSEEAEKLRVTVSSLQGSMDIMRERISQLEAEVEHYKHQGQKGVSEESYYFLEFLRSNYLELESLAGEIAIESELMAVLAERIAENCRRGLQSCQYLHELFSN